MEEENKKEKKKLGLKSKLIITFIIGLIIGLVIMFSVMQLQSVAKVKGALITKNEVYNTMKEYYSIELLLGNIDKKILNKECKITKEMSEEIKEEAENIIASYEDHGYSKEEFLEQNGFKSYDEFIEDISLYYQKSAYYANYLESLLEEGAVQKYFDENSFGEIDSKHILVKTSETMTDENALALANEIIAKLNAGEEFDIVADEYKAKNSENVITENLGYINFTNNIEETYVTALKMLEPETYTTIPVKTSYGYHIIYCKGKREGKLGTNVKVAIVTKLVEEVENLEDVKDYNTLIMELRKKYKLNFFDKDLKEKYEEYCKLYVNE